MKISLRLGEMCNKNCEYCDNKNIKTPRQIEVNDFIKKSNYIFNIIDKYNLEYSITGGEPGLIPVNIYNHVFDKISHKCTIVTNGLFFKNKLHSKYENKIKNIMYHCSDDIFKNEIIEPIDFKNVQYIILVHNKNLCYLNEFLKQNKNILFTIKLIERRDNNYEYLLNNEDLIKLVIIMNNNKNITNDIDMVEWYVNNDNIKDIRNVCSRFCYTPQIDFINNVIRKCYKTYTSIETVKLNDKNIYKLLTNKINLFKKPSKICNECTYLYAFMNQQHILYTRLNLTSKFRNDLKTVSKVCKKIEQI